MVLELVVADGGRTGVALRRHRGVHDLHGKGHTRRLSKMLPSLVTDTGAAALLPYDFVEWLVAPLLVPEDSVKDKLVYKYMVGFERMGAALDYALTQIKGDTPRSPAVLRAQMRRAAEKERAARDDVPTEYVVGDADLYEVATAFPTGAGVKDLYDWLEEVSFKDLLDPAGTLAIYGDLVQCVMPRFDPDREGVTHGTAISRHKVPC